jgi:hypothetical protein
MQKSLVKSDHQLERDSEKSKSPLILANRASPIVCKQFLSSDRFANHHRFPWFVKSRHSHRNGDALRQAKSTDSLHVLKETRCFVFKAREMLSFSSQLPNIGLYNRLFTNCKRSSSRQENFAIRHVLLRNRPNIAMKKSVNHRHIAVEAWDCMIPFHALTIHVEEEMLGFANPTAVSLGGHTSGGISQMFDAPGICHLALPESLSLSHGRCGKLDGFCFGGREIRADGSEWDGRAVPFHRVARESRFVPMNRAGENHRASTAREARGRE